MENQERHTELFDKYVLGTLTKAEEAELHALIENDSKLKLEFESHKLLVEGIKLARKEELKDYLKEHGKVEYFENIWGQKWRKASVVIVAVFLAAFFTVEYIKKQPVNQNPVAQKEKNQEKEEFSTQKELEEKPLREEPPKQLKTKEEVSEEEDLANFDFEEQGQTNFRDTLQKEAEELIQPKMESSSKDPMEKIAQERKLLDTTLVAFIAVVEPTIGKDDVVVRMSESSTQKKAEVKKKSKSTADESIETDVLKEEGLKERAKKSVKIPIELWQSPIHFKGYQYQEKLKLYGVSIDKIKLISLNNTLYIKIGEQYSALQKSTEYLPFKFITNPSIIAQLNAN